MLATGAIMRWFEPFPIDWRTGATFVHDWFALGVWIAVLGHILFAFTRSGRAARDDARRRHAVLGAHERPRGTAKL